MNHDADSLAEQSDTPEEEVLFDPEYSNAPWARQRARMYGLEAAMLTQARALSGMASVEDRLGGDPCVVTVHAYALDEKDGAVTYLCYTEGHPVDKGGGWFCCDAWFDPERPECRRAALAYIAHEFPFHREGKTPPAPLSGPSGDLA